MSYDLKDKQEGNKKKVKLNAASQARRERMNNRNIFLLARDFYYIHDDIIKNIFYIVISITAIVILYINPWETKKSEIKTEKISTENKNTDLVSSFDRDIDNNLPKFPKGYCLREWKRSESEFKLYFDAKYCKKGEGTAVLLIVRTLYELNHVKFPQKIIIYFGDGRIQSYPFSDIPSLLSKDEPII